jgi:hypothetical protein
MKCERKIRFVTAVMMLAACLKAQGTNDSDVRPPVTKADLQIAKRAREILNSRSNWNRADDRICPATAKTFSLHIQSCSKWSNSA